LLNDNKTRTTIITDLFLIEGFNDPIFPPSGWQSVIVFGTYNWERFPSGINPSCNPYEGSAMAAYRSYSAPPGSQARLITPSINIGPILSACSLKFMMYHSTGYPTVAESIKIEVSTDGINFTQVAAFRRYAVQSGWQEHSIYLGAYANTIYVGFLAYAGYGNNMYIDYVRIFGRQLPPNDVGVDEIISPGSWHLFNTPMAPIARVKNYGSATQSNFVVVCTILGTGNLVRYTDTKTVATLTPNDTTWVNFTSWTPSIMERCSIRIRTMLNGDQNPANDLKTIITDINFLTEKFTNELFPPLGWTVYNFDGGTQMWERYTSGPYTTPACASCRYESSTLLNNDWLITPRIGPLRINDSLIFYYRNYSSTFTDTMLIRVSTNPAVNDTASFTIIDIIATNANSWNQKAISLSQFAGNQVYIAFNYRCLYKFRIAIDNIEIRGYAAGISENRVDKFTYIPIFNRPYPNLISNGIVSISFTLSEPAKVNAVICDVTGKLIKTLVDTDFQSGIHKFFWDCTNEQNKRVSPGVYFYRLKMNNDLITEKILILR
ncbi:MAG: choice-of-anchor J domain-containing protein, partial [candidate division WOR-3 bacterium]